MENQTIAKLFSTGIIDVSKNIALKAFTFMFIDVCYVVYATLLSVYHQ
jgi:hypothetical protein